MIEPTFDADGYPTDETLAAISGWEFRTMSDFEAAMDFAGRAWSGYGTWVKDTIEEFGITRLRYVFSTGGWSGNESIVAAIEAHKTMSLVGAWSWRRGGHYEYRFPMEKES